MDILKKFGDMTRNELIRGSLALLILFNLGNIFSYLFQVSMARMLGPVDYGILAVLTSITYIFSVPTMSIQTVVSKHTMRLAVRNEYGKIKGFFGYMVKKMLLIAFIIFIFFSILSLFLSNAFNISFFLLIIIGLFIFGSFVYPITTGVLQGLKKFQAWGWNNIFMCSIKLVIAIILVLLGLGVYGASLGIVLSIIISFFLAIPFLKMVFSAEKEEEKIFIFSKNVLSTFFAMLIVVVIYSSDVIFAKIFFSPDIVGKYAVISMIGKIILFGAVGIGNAMFPISLERFENGNRTREIFKKALLAALLWCGILVLSFFVFPELIIKVLFGGEYLDLGGILVYMGIAFSFISFLNIFILYKISNDKFKMKHVPVLLFFLLIQILVFYLFNSDIETFSKGFMFSSIATFIGSLILIRK